MSLKGVIHIKGITIFMTTGHVWYREGKKGVWFREVSLYLLKRFHWTLY